MYTHAHLRHARAHARAVVFRWFHVSPCVLEQHGPEWAWMSMGPGVYPGTCPCSHGRACAQPGRVNGDVKSREIASSAVAGSVSHAQSTYWQCIRLRCACRRTDCSSDGLSYGSRLSEGSVPHITTCKLLADLHRHHNASMASWLGLVPSKKHTVMSPSRSNSPRTRVHVRDTSAAKQQRGTHRWYDSDPQLLQHLQLATSEGAVPHECVHCWRYQ